MKTSCLWDGKKLVNLLHSAAFRAAYKRLVNVLAVRKLPCKMQAVLFYFPTIIWHGLNQKAGVDADSILAAAHTFSRTDRAENRDRTLKMLVNQMERFLSSRHQPNKRRCDTR